MSLPNSRGVSPAASAAAPPPVEPPGVRLRSQGLLVRPYTGLLDCQSDSIWGTFVFAMTTAPAPFTRVVTGASCSDRKSFHVDMPAVVRSPRTLMDSFRVIGRPSSGASSPPARRASAASAPRRAPPEEGPPVPVSPELYPSVRRP